MYSKQTNKSALYSQNMIADALLSLLRRKDFQQITVTELCNEAAIGRKTFYRNFELREDVIDFILDSLIATYRDDINGLTYEEMLYHHFSFVQKHTEFFYLLYKNNLRYMAEQKFSALLPQTMPIWSENSTLQEYHSKYVIAGIEAIMRTWIERNFKESLDEVIELTKKIQKI